MTIPDRKSIAALMLLTILLIGGPIAIASDEDDLTLMLNEFLAHAGLASAHERFWDEELVYTSSNGTRTTKAEIMQGFGASDDDGDGDEEPGPVYTAEDIDIRVYGTTAVVAFRLVATEATATGDPETGVAIQEYFNTGTFVKRGDSWKAVAWQATKIPGP